MAKIFAMGDLHGRLDLLVRALKAIDAHSDRVGAKIITLGDYVDRGPDSAGIIALLMEQQAADKDFICIQGNHEAMMLQTILAPLKPDWWIGNGGHATLYSYGHPKLKVSRYLEDVSLGFVPDEHLRWMGALPLYHETANHVFVHAGIPNDGPLEKQPSDKLQWMMYNNAIPTGGWRGKHVVHGHVQYEDGPHSYPGAAGGRTNLDTFAWLTGRLVVGIFDEDKPTKPVELLEVK